MEKNLLLLFTHKQFRKPQISIKPTPAMSFINTTTDQFDHSNLDTVLGFDTNPQSFSAMLAQDDFGSPDSSASNLQALKNDFAEPQTSLKPTISSANSTPNQFHHSEAEEDWMSLFVNEDAYSAESSASDHQASSESEVSASKKRAYTEEDDSPAKRQCLPAAVPSTPAKSQYHQYLEAYINRSRGPTAAPTMASAPAKIYRSPYPPTPQSLAASLLSTPQKSQYQKYLDQHRAVAPPSPISPTQEHLLRLEKYRKARRVATHKKRSNPPAVPAAREGGW